MASQLEKLLTEVTADARPMLVTSKARTLITDAWHSGHREAMRLMADGLKTAMDDAQAALESGKPDLDVLRLLVRELEDVRKVAEAQS